ncbi:MAG: hypothetical protein QGI13_15480 [Rhodospirillales bacterium]|nr:hypothetical protein [Rhodospirillales bacterium]
MADSETEPDQTRDQVSDPRPELDDLQAMQGNWLFKRLPPWVMDTLTNDQKAAIHDAVTDPSWQRHVVNIRVSLPFFRQRFYITVVGGGEKRDAERRAAERHHYPLRTIANVFFVIGAATIFYAIALVALAFQATIFEF